MHLLDLYLCVFPRVGAHHLYSAPAFVFRSGAEFCRYTYSHMFQVSQLRMQMCRMLECCDFLYACGQCVRKVTEFVCLLQGFFFMAHYAHNVVQVLRYREELTFLLNYMYWPNSFTVLS